MSIDSIDELVPEGGVVTDENRRELLKLVRKAGRAQLEAYHEWLRHHVTDRELLAISICAWHMYQYGSHDHLAAPDFPEVAQAAEQRFQEWYALRNRTRDERGR